MAKKPPSAAEREYMGLVARLDCAARGCGVSPVEVHHPRHGAGMGQRASHFDVIPLCPAHHRTGGFGVAIHAGQKTWEAKFGIEAELTKKTQHLVKELSKNQYVVFSM